MTMIKKRMLSMQEVKQLDKSLYYCKIGELKNICERLHISKSGKKQQLITNIIHFVTHGSEAKINIKIPSSSSKKPHTKYPLSPNTLIVFGSYKNDLATRIFLKKLIGNHFHFTVFGHDWIKERWHTENPPTYAEFAEFWQHEYMQRKNKQQPLKTEWAYLNFIRNFIDQYPKASKNEILAAWEKIRLEHKENAFHIIFK